MVKCGKCKKEVTPVKNKCPECGILIMSKGMLIGFGAFVAVFIVFMVAAATPGVIVRQSDYGKDWPFSVEWGRLYNDNGAAVFEIENGKQYALNGVATQRGFASINSVWRDNPNLPGTKIPISYMILVANNTPK